MDNVAVNECVQTMSVLFFRLVVVTHLVSLMKNNEKDVFSFISCLHSQPLPQSLTGFPFKSEFD